MHMTWLTPSCPKHAQSERHPSHSCTFGEPVCTWFGTYSPTHANIYTHNHKLTCTHTHGHYRRQSFPELSFSTIALRSKVHTAVQYFCIGPYGIPGPNSEQGKMSCENCFSYWVATIRILWYSLKLWVPFAEYSLFYRALLQKRPIIVRSLRMVATPYESIECVRVALFSFLFHFPDRVCWNGCGCEYGCGCVCGCMFVCVRVALFSFLLHFPNRVCWCGCGCGCEYGCECVCGCMFACVWVALFSYPFIYIWGGYD